MLSQIFQQRLTDLLDNITQDQKLLKEFEEALTVEDNPRTLKKYKKEKICVYCMYFKKHTFVCYKYSSTKYVIYSKLVDTINGVDLSQHASGMPKTGDE